VNATSEGQAHQFMIGGMEFHQISSVTEAIERTQLRRISVGQAGKILNVHITRLFAGTPK
jgi:hypothetical protein